MSLNVVQDMHYLYTRFNRIKSYPKDEYVYEAKDANVTQRDDQNKDVMNALTLVV